MRKIITFVTILGFIVTAGMGLSTIIKGFTRRIYGIR